MTWRALYEKFHKWGDMRSRLDDLIIAKFVTFEECCSTCLVLYRFEEAQVTQQGQFLQIMLLCPECGDRKKVALHSWYHKRGLMKNSLMGADNDGWRENRRTG